MKTLRLVLCLFIAQGCNKQTSTPGNQLTGRWMLTAIADRFGPQRELEWRMISPEQRQFMVFLTDSTFQQFGEGAGIMPDCAGDYSLRFPNTIRLSSSCQPAKEDIIISHLSEHILIIGRSATEGVINYRYLKVK